MPNFIQIRSVKIIMNAGELTDSPQTPLHFMAFMQGMNESRMVAISILGLQHRTSVEISTAQFTLWLTPQRGNLP
jgi:hypothetical protein